MNLRHLRAWPGSAVARAQLRQRWNALLGCCPGSSIFQSYEWHEAWWSSFGADYELHLLLIEQAERLLAIAPFVVDVRRGLAGPRRCLRLLGSCNAASDYADCIVAADQPEARIAIFDWLADNPVQWQRLELDNLPAASPSLALGATHVRLPQPLRQFAAKAPARRLGDAAADRTVLQKKSLRRHINGLRRQGPVILQRLRTRSDIERHLPMFFAQHCARWAGTRTPSLFHDLRQQVFYHALTRSFADDERLNFSAVLWRDRPIAYHFGFEWQGVFTWYKPSFDPTLAEHSPGEALLYLLFEDVIGRGLREFDFTVGNEAFKYRFANIEREVHRLRVYARLAERLPALARHELKHWLRKPLNKFRGFTGQDGSVRESSAKAHDSA